MLRLRDKMSKATNVTIDESQEFNVFEMLAVCLHMDPCGQLKGCGEERQEYSVFVDGSPSGANWTGAGSPFHTKPRVPKAIDQWRHRVGTIEATETYRCGRSLCNFILTQVPHVISQLQSLMQTDNSHCCALFWL